MSSETREIRRNLENLDKKLKLHQIQPNKDCNSQPATSYHT
uniref:Uncharacterized protein n=1 Tax=Arundo donax TaxID=35708 RepID=A0A0A9H3U5_ARUDO